MKFIKRMHFNTDLKFSFKIFWIHAELLNHWFPRECTSTLIPNTLFKYFGYMLNFSLVNFQENLLQHWSQTHFSNILNTCWTSASLISWRIHFNTDLKHFLKIFRIHVELLPRWFPRDITSISLFSNILNICWTSASLIS